MLDENKRWEPSLSKAISTEYAKVSPENVCKLIDVLSEKEKHVILSIFRDNKTIRALSKEFGVSNTMISVIKRNAVYRMRENAFKVSDTSILLSDVRVVGLSGRCYNALRRAGIETVGDLDRFLKQGGNIRLIRNIGPSSEKEIEEFVEANHLGSNI